MGTPKVALIFEVAGTRTVPPYERLAYRAAEACGRLPLVLAVAGGILAEAGGRLTEDFIALIHEDRTRPFISFAQRLLCLHADSYGARRHGVTAGPPLQGSGIPSCLVSIFLFADRWCTLATSLGPQKIVFMWMV